MKTFSKEKLSGVLNSHLKWLNNKHGGVCADLSGANLFKTGGIIRIDTDLFCILVTRSHAHIGCQYKTHREWIRVSKQEAVEMGLPERCYITFRHLIGAALKQLKAQP